MSSVPRPSQETQDRAAELGAVIDGPIHAASQVLQGKVPNHPDKDMGHPIHPATVHWPIAVSSFWIRSVLLQPEGGFAPL